MSNARESRHPFRDENGRAHPEAAGVLEDCRAHGAGPELCDGTHAMGIEATGVPDGEWTVAVVIEDGRIVDVLPVDVLAVEDPYDDRDED